MQQFPAYVQNLPPMEFQLPDWFDSNHVELRRGVVSNQDVIAVLVKAKTDQRYFLVDAEGLLKAPERILNTILISMLLSELDKLPTFNN